MIQVGQRVHFDAFWYMRMSVERAVADVIGTVEYVNEPHHWFSVRYGENQHTSFMFSEIGENVWLCK